MYCAGNRSYIFFYPEDVYSERIPAYTAWMQSNKSKTPVPFISRKKKNIYICIPCATRRQACIALFLSSRYPFTQSSNLQSPIPYCPRIENNTKVDTFYHIHDFCFGSYSCSSSPYFSLIVHILIEVYSERIPAYCLV